MRNLLLLFLFPALLLAQNSEFTTAENYFKKEQFEKAQPLFENYLKNHPKDLETREYLGDIAANERKWDTAIDYYKALVEENEQNANFHFKYGGALGMKALSISRIRALTYISDIKFHFIKAAELDPNHIETRWALIELYLQLPGIVGGSVSKAEKYADELQAISPVDGYLSKGYIAEHNDDTKVAEYNYKKAIAIGGSAHTYEKLTALYEKNDKPKEALDTASTSLQIHKRNQVNYQIGKISAEYKMESELGLESLKAYISNHSVKDGVPV
ncbi:MAG: tetratricopeptide repeat protein, partial [Leeuwenhoekiella sp.]